MGEALQAVLQLKSNEEQQRQQAVSQAIQQQQLLQQARQQAAAQQLQQLQLAQSLKREDNAQNFQQLQYLNTIKQNELNNKRLSNEDASQSILRAAQVKALEAQANAFNNSGNSGDLDPVKLQEAGIFPEDIQMTPKQISYKGMQKTILTPELKKQVSQKETTDLGDIDSTVSDLQKNIDNLKKFNINSGPGYSTSGLPGADIYSQFTKSPEFNTWKADTGRAFQKYRKWATGVAAGYPELRLLTPNFPKASDRPDVYISKSKSAMDDMNRNKTIILDYLNKSGYRTGALRNTSNQSNTAQEKSTWTPEKEARLQELRKKVGNK